MKSLESAVRFYIVGETGTTKRYKMWEVAGGHTSFATMKSGDNLDVQQRTGVKALEKLRRISLYFPGS